MIERTPWYPVGTKPIRDGVYELQSYFPHRKVFLAYWNGFRWMNNEIRWLSFDRGEWCKWRGLTIESRSES